VAKDALGEWPSPPEGRQLTNIVLMGMGEAALQLRKCRRRDEDRHGPGGCGLRGKITLSTAGVVPMLARVGAELGSTSRCRLHAVNDELRDRLVSAQPKYPIRELLDACRTYPGSSNARRITFEYVI